MINYEVNKATQALCKDLEDKSIAIEQLACTIAQDKQSQAIEIKEKACNILSKVKNKFKELSANSDYDREFIEAYDLVINRAKQLYQDSVEQLTALSIQSQEPKKMEEIDKEELNKLFDIEEKAVVPQAEEKVEEDSTQVEIEQVQKEQRVLSESQQKLNDEAVNMIKQWMNNNGE